MINTLIFITIIFIMLCYYPSIIYLIYTNLSTSQPSAQPVLNCSNISIINKIKDFYSKQNLPYDIYMTSYNSKNISDKICSVEYTYDGTWG
jgi:hypothetical protein